MKHFLLSCAVAAFGMIGAAHASTVTVTGNATQLASVPAAVNNATPGSNDGILWFQESSRMTVTADVTGLGGTGISVGDVVDTYMIFLNRASGGATLTASATFSFTTDILGVFGQQDGEDLEATDYLATATNYGANFANRGIENGNDFSFSAGTNNDLLSLIGTNGLNVNLLRVTQPGDWVRVATVAAIPVPAGAFLLPLGLGALGFASRRKRKAAAA